MDLELPFPPSANHYYRRLGHVALISRRGRAYREMVMALLAAKKIKTLNGPIALIVELFPPDHRRRDLDNTLKALLDALQHAGAFHDDSQVVRLEATKREPVAGGKVRVAVVAAARTATRTVRGWVAVNNRGLVRGSFREDQDKAALAARRILRLAGGRSLVGGFRLVRATLIHDDAHPPASRSRKTETETG